MIVDAVWLARYHAEQPSQILHKLTPDLRRYSKPLKQWSELFRRGPTLAFTLLTSRPIQQLQVIGCRHRQESLVAAPSSRFVNVRPRLTNTPLQFHLSQMPTATSRSRAARR